MDTEDIWRIWEILSNFISNKDKADAIEEFLQHIYDTDACEIKDLKDYADEYGDDTFVKCAKRFMKENELYDDYED